MCFSATASFTSAAVLVSVGAVTTAMNTSKPHRMFVAIPILFGLQQASEGLVWLGLGHDYPLWLQQIGVLGFLGFALVIWPSWVPWSIYKTEAEPLRRKALMWMGFAGLAVSVMSAWSLYISQPTPYITGQCMAYSLKGLTRDVPPNVDFLLYMATVPLPFFVSSLKDIKITGALIMVGLFISHIINREASASVWCFFAAIASFHIAWSVVGSKDFVRKQIHF